MMTLVPMNFTYRENHPYDGCFSFVSGFAEEMGMHPSVRPTYSPTIDAIAAWCVERFGPAGAKSPWDFSKMGVFYFDNQNDAFEFRMAWC